ncbi:MAG: AAA family ATPase, partial [Bacteroidales bacterium]|nr:AAA family ATPase [Bacteroidales bacterium]
MIVYNADKRQFVQDVKSNVIATKILDLIRERGLNAGQEREFASWHNSMKFMRDIVDDSEIEDDVQIAIEYNIPQTSKRVDFIILGTDANGKENIVIVELKQWTKAEKVDDDMHFSVRTYVANDNRIVCHPSYQAYSYSRFLVNYSQT